MPSPRELFEALRRPAAVRVLVAYAGAGWLVVAVVEATTRYAGAPGWISPAAIAALLAAAPALVYRILRRRGAPGRGSDAPPGDRVGPRARPGPEGERRDARGSRPGARPSPSALQLVIPLLLSLTLVGLALVGIWWALADGSGLR